MTNFINIFTLAVSGKDAFDFLQGQITCDMREVTESPHPAAFCNHQGRVIASGKIHKNQENYFFDLPAELAEKLLNNLQKYARFSQVSLEILPENNTQKINLLNTIRQKTAVILSSTSEKFTPHELSYPQLDYISFQKGCYRGQEIIARMEYLGKLKKQLKHIIINSSEQINTTHILVNIAKTQDHDEALVIAPI